MTKIILFLFLVTTAFTCSKNEQTLGEDDYITLTYAQTQCADPWQTSNDDNVTAQNVKSYLEAAGITVISVKIKRTYEGAVCAACTCPSGKTIYVTTLNDGAMKEKFKNFKFQ